MSATTRRMKRREERLRQRARARDGTLEPRDRCQAYYARAVCGCCEVGPMHFMDLGTLKRAWRKMGLTVWGTLVDDVGETHHNIDTFYGFWTK